MLYENMKTLSMQSNNKGLLEFKRTDLADILSVSYKNPKF